MSGSVDKPVDQFLLQPMGEHLADLNNNNDRNRSCTCRKTLQIFLKSEREVTLQLIRTAMENIYFELEKMQWQNYS